MFKELEERLSTLNRAKKILKRPKSNFQRWNDNVCDKKNTLYRISKVDIAEENSYIEDTAIEIIHNEMDRGKFFFKWIKCQLGVGQL